MSHAISGQPATALRPLVKHFFETDTNTFSYVVKDPDSDACAIVDSVLNYDMASSSVDHDSADEIIRYVQDNKLRVEWIIETHVHADHLTAAPYIQERVGGKIGIGEDVTTVQSTFKKIFNIKDEFQPDGQQFDHLFKDGEHYSIGNLDAFVIHTPGHTPACMTHVIGDAAFVGDTLFMPDAGTARADFPGGDAAQLFDSIHKILALPEETRIFMCHDYGTTDRDQLLFETTVAAERDDNIHVNQSVPRSKFVEMRTARDKTLGMPHLILPSLQINMRAGHFPATEDNGLVYLKLPVDAFK
ncbi:MAG: MBL fold metallo-hydrolase [Pseudohongiellaceae bacterium]|jgi:glyoxylase-like metal-dependent hydrolase (beta-lactamase superfamily II)